MLGINDPWIIAAYLLSFLSAVACIVYGLYNWNKGGNDEDSQITEEVKWEKEENQIEENL
jgi:hypothetical protein